VTVADLLEGIVGYDGTVFSYQNMPHGIEHSDRMKLLSLYPQYRITHSEVPVSGAGRAGRALLQVILPGKGPPEGALPIHGEFERPVATGSEETEGDRPTGLWGDGTDVPFMEKIVREGDPSCSKKAVKAGASAR
jgi:hypothetical protein